ncbi:MAG: hypothetical protein HZC54_20395 [Verrucomicrobia bacterium]|nr:hypothetical protein [Verrucomicrobiota bacterium]
MITRFAALFLLVAFIGAACAPSMSQAVRNLFLREHPDYTVISVRSDGRDRDATNFHIRYRRPNDNNEHEDVWRVFGGTRTIQKSTIR